MRNGDIERIERIIGYEFRDISLLERAFVHKSSTPNNHLASNQRLEFLGDSVLSLVVSVKLFSSYPNACEGDLTNMRKSVVSKTPLAEYILKHNLLDYLSVGLGDIKSGMKEKNYSDLFEAITGAIYLDGGFDAAVKFVETSLSGVIEGVATRRDVDAKSAFIEYAASKKSSWEFVRVTDEEKDGYFVCEAILDYVVYGKGSGGRILDAEMMAATRAMYFLKKN